MRKEISSTLTNYNSEILLLYERMTKKNLMRSYLIVVYIIFTVYHH